MTLPSERLNRRWSWKSWTALGSGVALVVGLGITAAVTGPLASAAPEPTATSVVPHAASCDTYRGDVCYTPEMDAAADQQEEQIAADQAAAAQAAAEAAAAQAAADQAAQRQASQRAAQKEASGPVRCPGGTTANSNDGVNDTSCFPDICFHITVPDPAHPECDVAFKP